MDGKVDTTTRAQRGKGTRNIDVIIIDLNLPLMLLLLSRCSVVIRHDDLNSQRLNDQ